jgi:hypothetical protein
MGKFSKEKISASRFHLFFRKLWRPIGTGAPRYSPTLRRQSNSISSFGIKDSYKPIYLLAVYTRGGQTLLRQEGLFLWSREHGEIEHDQTHG